MLRHLLRLVRPRKRAPGRPPRRPNYRPRLEPLEDRLAPATLPSGFTETPAASGLTNATAIELSPDGKLFVSEQAGTMEVWQSGTRLQANFFANTPLTIDPVGERGLLGIAFDPNYVTNRFLYVYYTASTPISHNRVSRFTANAGGDQALAGSETVLLDLEPLSDSFTGHNGGALHFGPDGKLYLAVGENSDPAQAQSLDSRLGKILRINPDGSIPTDNPTSFQGVTGTTTGVNRSIWAIGLRNPFTTAFQPGTGRFFINDVGHDSWEEINEGFAGRNYGWPHREGPAPGITPPFTGSFTEPVYAYQHGSGTESGNTIAGGAFYNPATVQFPSSYVGNYFFGDFVNGWIKRFDPVTGSVTVFASSIGPFSVVDLRVSPDGSLYYLDRGAGGVFRVTSTTNQPPVLQPIADRVVPSSQDIIMVPLSATDPDGDPTTLSATAQSLAYVLDQQLELNDGGSQFDNWGGRGEKWLLTASGTWYFIVPDGELYLWDGSGPTNLTGTLVGNVGASYHANLALLYNAVANQPHAALGIAGGTLTIDREDGFVGAVVVTVTASDGRGGTDSKVFTATVVTNRPPMLSPIADRTVPSSQTVIRVPLSAADPDGDPVTLTAAAQSLAYVLRQQTGPVAYDASWNNWGGRNERWLTTPGGQWYFILPGGEYYRWDGSPAASGALLGNVGASYWLEPMWLQDPPENQPRATLSVSGGTLSITRDLAWVSALVVTVTAADGRGGTDIKTFLVAVSG